MNIADIFEKYDREFLSFEKVENKRSRRSDLHAFLLLDELQPASRDIIGAAEHDEVYLDVDLEELAKVAIEDQIIELIRCGVRYDDEVESLAMFV